jgi:hypothetical protein
MRPQAQTDVSGNGVGAQAAAAAAARERLGRDLDQLAVEVRAQMGLTLERITWKAAVAVSAVLTGLVVKKALAAGWRATRHDEPPEDLGDPRNRFGEALAWTLATAVGMGLAKVVAARGAAAGWRKATGQPPPVEAAGHP